MKYMSYASGQYVMSIDEVEDISEIRESGVYALEGYAHPVAVHIIKNDDTEETDDGSQIFYSDKGIRYLVREMEKNLYRLIKNSETFPKEEEEAYEDMLHQSNYISQRMHEIDEEERIDAIEDREEAEMVAYYCALYDMENGMSEGKSLDRLQDEYMSMPEEELLFQYQAKYEEKPLLHETRERLRTRTHGGRVRVKEE